MLTCNLHIAGEGSDSSRKDAVVVGECLKCQYGPRLLCRHPRGTRIISVIIKLFNTGMFIKNSLGMIGPVFGGVPIHHYEISMLRKHLREMAYSSVWSQNCTVLSSFHNREAKHTA